MRTKTKKTLFRSGIKKFITFLLIISFWGFHLLTFPQELTQPFKLSLRINRVIDSNTRNYFYLFPEISDFQSAQIFKLSEDSYKIKIKLRPGAIQNDTILTLGSKGYFFLKYYIEDFEIIRIRNQKLPSYIYQTPFIDLPKLEEMKKLEKKKKREFTKVYLTNGMRVKGNLLYTNKEALGMWPGLWSYDWNNNQDVENFDYTSIDRIIVKEKDNVGKGIGLGFLIGGGVGMLAGLIGSSGGDGLFNPDPFEYGFRGMIVIGVPSAIIGGIIGSIRKKKADVSINANEVLYKQALPELNKHSYFPESKPPEINRIIQNNKKD